MGKWLKIEFLEGDERFFKFLGDIQNKLPPV